MPDWKAVLLERMESLGLCPAQEEEIASELAGHVEDCYEEFRAQGICQSEAIERCLEQVGDGPNLTRKIRHAKHKEEMMNHRTKTFWLPALISLVAAMVLLMISTQIALQPRVLAEPVVTLRTSTTSYSFAAYLPWLILLPFCGAAGAYLSRRAGGQPALRLVAGLFPVVVLFGLVTVLALIGQIVPFQHQWLAFVTALLFLMVPPSIALFLGVMPFLKEPRRRAVVNR